jgi:3-methyladenine DNA glycosylase AlkD
MEVNEVMTFLQDKGSDSIKKILLKHGVKEPFFGVKIEYLKEIQKKVKTDNQLAKSLYDTGNADAMYLAGLITDDNKIEKADLQTWVQQAYSNNIADYTVPWVAAGSRFGYQLGLEWIDSQQEHIAAAGWSTLAHLVMLKPDNELDIPVLKKLLERVEQTIHTAPNRVKSLMNSFISAIGTYVSPLTNDAIATANRIGDVMVDMGNTCCKLRPAGESIQKVQAKGAIGKKKKMVKC